MDSIGALIPITTAVQADPLLLPNTQESMRLFVDANTGQVNTIDATGLITPVGGGGSLVLLKSEVTIDAAQVLTMGTTPVVIVPSVPNKQIIPIYAVAALKYGTIPYATHGNLYLAGATATKGLFFVPESDFLFSTSDTNCVLPFEPPTPNLQMFAGVDSLVAGIELGNPTAGDSDLDIVVVYFVF